MNKFLSIFVATVVCGPLVIGIVQERNRFTPDVWTGTPTTVRAEPTQAARDFEMRSKMAVDTAKSECLPGWTLSSRGGFCTKGTQVEMPNSVRKAVEQEVVRSLSFDQKKIDATFAYMLKHNLSPNEVCKSKLRRNHEDYCQRGGL
jgi:hypothetical protein